MTGLRNVFGLAALGSTLVWSSAGWARQESDKPPQKEAGRAETKEIHTEKSTRERREALKKQTEELTDRMRRLKREHLRRGFEFSIPPFHLNVRGDGYDWYLSEPRSNELGAGIVSAEEALRTQLGLPDGQGLSVKSVEPDGPAARVGLQVNDILTTLAGKPLATPADLIKQLKEAGEKPVPLQILRSGKSMTIQVKPESHVTFGPVAATRPQYQLGVQVATLDETLRSQLKVPDREGLLVSVVETGSAAEKAGLKKHDILLAVGEQPLRSPEDLVNQIQNSDGKALNFKLLRAGKIITLEVAPALKPDTETDSPDLDNAPSVRGVRPSGLVLPQRFDPSFPFPRAYDPLWRQRTGNFPVRQTFTLPHTSGSQHGDLQGEVMELRRLIEQLQNSLQTKPASDRSGQ
ncbi:PDZ domain-containing protein [Singulisphaera sp. Ch08]|uniref:PDZ domain-containing protein n=1 Tax=Singulisphaera sp. Ch08 TaxID=3120278 RepID=A0AAU7CTA7_9BACT